MKQDFAQPLRENSRKPAPVTNEIFLKRRFFLVGMGFFLLAVSVWMMQSKPASSPVEYEEWLPVMALDSTPDTNAFHATHQKVVLKAGDSSLAVLKQMGFSYQQVKDMEAAAKGVYSLTHVRAGHAFVREDTTEGAHVLYHVDGDQRLHLQESDGVWKAALEDRPVWHRQRYAEVTITDNLFSDASSAGMDNRTIMNLVDIFAWDIDFARELRIGDHFRILYESNDDVEGKEIGTTILAAEFTNQGQTYSAVRYVLKSEKVDYFSMQGESLRKTYLKAPVKFSRISSRFSGSRMHPVLGYTRAHKGVDYAAATGTPIHAIGDGRIMFSGWKGGYGRMVILRHTNRNHTTRYGHMSAFGRGIHSGMWVKQGKIIGYVGKSGVATGPHLHFEFRVGGRAVNPLSIKHDPAEPVPSAERAAFQDEVRKVQEAFKRAAEKKVWG